MRRQVEDLKALETESRLNDELRRLKRELTTAELRVMTLAEQVSVREHTHIHSHARACVCGGVVATVAVAKVFRAIVAVAAVVREAVIEAI